MDTQLAQQDLVAEAAGQAFYRRPQSAAAEGSGGHSVEELAQMTGMNENTIKVKLFRARQKLVKAAQRLTRERGKLSRDVIQLFRVYETDDMIRKGFRVDLLREEVMHQSIKGSLEDYLNGCRERIPQEFHVHLRACESCARELKALEMQSQMLRALRPAEESDPPAGFYARVMERIDDQRRSSIWSAFLRSAFRQAPGGSVGSLDPASGDLSGHHRTGRSELAPQSAVVMTDGPAATDAAIEDAAIQQDSAAQQQQRNAVLVDLASYHE